MNTIWKVPQDNISSRTPPVQSGAAAAAVFSLVLGAGSFLLGSLIVKTGCGRG